MNECFFFCCGFFWASRFCIGLLWTVKGIHDLYPNWLPQNSCCTAVCSMRNIQWLQGYLHSYFQWIILPKQTNCCMYERNNEESESSPPLFSSHLAWNPDGSRSNDTPTTQMSENLVIYAVTLFKENSETIHFLSRSLIFSSWGYVGTQIFDFEK